MNNLRDEYKIKNIKVINERIVSKDSKNIIELLYELFLFEKKCDNNDRN